MKTVMSFSPLVYSFNRLLIASGLLLAGSGRLAAADTPPALPEGYELVYEQNFESPESLAHFVMTDPKAWKLTRTNDQVSMELTRQSNYQMPVVPTTSGKVVVRSPVNIALLAGKVFTDFVLEVDMLQTGKEYGHRDMCLFFGVTDPTKFYYVHIATAADPNAHNVFIVNEKPRTNIARETTKGVNWGLNVWHKVRIVRRAAAGSIQVYFDDLSKPIMIAEDKTFTSGYLGFGSFDDTGMIDNIRIWAPSVEAKPTKFFSAPQ
jgi:hypothetical protein